MRSATGLKGRLAPVGATAAAEGRLLPAVVVLVDPPPAALPGRVVLLLVLLFRTGDAGVACGVLGAHG